MVIQLLLAIALVAFIHLCLLASCAQALGITVLDVTFGIGPRMLGTGMFRLSWLPFGGSVRLATLSDAGDGTPAEGTLELQPRWKRVALPLSGPAGLFLLGWRILGGDAVDQLKDGFAQLLGGAVAPFGEAQVLLHTVATRLSGADALTTVGLVACKFAAWNLIPYTGSNGLQALEGVLSPGFLASQRMLRMRAIFTLPLLLLLLGGWAVALVLFSIRS